MRFSKCTFKGRGVNRKVYKSVAEKTNLLSVFLIVGCLFLALKKPVRPASSTAVLGNKSKTEKSKPF